ncbi:MAG: hypothetical protein NXH75_03510 [Halobacteriovoraceae bacterium]|nr:hypothetical protein [Halobacteriovoraceae bacterium]
MKLSKLHGVPFKHRTYHTRYTESAETQKVRALGNRIKEIQRETQYIKDNGNAPPANPFGESYFLKKLNSLS